MQLLTAGTRDVSTLAFSPDSLALVAACPGGDPYLWTLPATAPPVPLVGGLGAYQDHAFSFDPDANVVGWLIGYKRMEYDRRTGITREARISPEGELWHGQVTCESNNWLIVQTMQNLSARVFSLRAFTPGARGWSEAWTIGPTETFWLRLAGSRAERFFTWEVSTAHEGRPSALAVRSAQTGEVIASADAPIRYPLGFVASPDGSALVVFRNASLYFWRVGEKVARVRTGTLKHYRSLAFHPDGRHLLAGNNDTTARIIDTHTWRVVRQYTWDVGELSAVAVSPDGNLAAAGGRKGRVVVWDLDL